MLPKHCRLIENGDFLLCYRVECFLNITLTFPKHCLYFREVLIWKKMPSVTLPVKGTLTKCQDNIALRFNNHSPGNIKAMRKKVPILNQSAMFRQHFLGMLGQC